MVTPAVPVADAAVTQAGAVSAVPPCLVLPSGSTGTTTEAPSIPAVAFGLEEVATLAPSIPVATSRAGTAANEAVPKDNGDRVTPSSTRSRYGREVRKPKRFLD